MHGEKALHLRIPDSSSDSELQLSGEFVGYFDLTWIPCVLVRPLVISYLNYLIILVINYNIIIMIRNCDLSNLNKKDCQGFSQTFFYFVFRPDLCGFTAVKEHVYFSTICYHYIINFKIRFFLFRRKKMDGLKNRPFFKGSRSGKKVFDLFYSLLILNSMTASNIFHILTKRNCPAYQFCLDSHSVFVYLKTKVH